MRRRPERAARVPGAWVIVGVTLAVTGCGDSGGASEKAYYGSIDTFCAQVTTAARQVSRDTVAVRRDRTADSTKVVKVVTASLNQFADSTEGALRRLEKTSVPKAFKAYQSGTSAGFRRFIATLRSTAKATSTGGAAALDRLGPELNAVKLPDPPAAVTANAKACASFTPAA